MKYPKEFSSSGPLSPLYQSWKNMHGRCNPRGKYEERYRIRYANRGITVCEEWQSWPVFAAWALANQWKRGLSIDRIDNDSGYRPSNCRFVSALEQNRNRDMELVRSSIQSSHIKRWKKPFLCIETGQLFQTQMEAFRQCGVDRKTLRLALAGQYKTAGQLHWAYV